MGCIPSTKDTNFKHPIIKSPPPPQETILKASIDFIIKNHSLRFGIIPPCSMHNTPMMQLLLIRQLDRLKNFNYFNTKKDFNNHMDEMSDLSYNIDSNDNQQISVVY